MRLGELLVEGFGLGAPVENKVYAATALSGVVPNVPYKVAASSAAYAADPGATKTDAEWSKPVVDELKKLFTPGEGEADVFPGRRHKLPTTELIWASRLISPPVSWAGEGGWQRLVEFGWLFGQAPPQTCCVRPPWRVNGRGPPAPPTTSPTTLPHRNTRLLE
jgi:hypothetical protein